MGHGDRLGKVIKIYRPNTAAGVMAAILMFLAGGGVLLYCQFHRPYPFKIIAGGSCPSGCRPGDGCRKPFQQPAIP
jgi:hypothetical protein